MTTHLRAVALLFSMCLIGCGSTEHADGDADEGEVVSFGFSFHEIDVEGVSYRYAKFVPDGLQASAAEPAPMIVFLHGSGECGTDGLKQITVGIGPRLAWEPERYQAVVLLPQKPVRESEWEDFAPAVDAMIDAAIAEFTIDADRVSLTGLSQGGHGTWSLNEALPGRFSALAPVCGYTERFWPLEITPEDDSSPGQLTDRLVEGARGMPVWIFHGEQDRVVPATESKKMLSKLDGIASEVKLTLYPDADHNSWDAAYTEPGFGEWLTNHRRAAAGQDSADADSYFDE